ncbi:MAG TPA: hypothetical protein VLI04_17950 [Nocardioidaceae bacterium]|nr:hypothetical protein [Nocardioidaceae bacterium]
MTGRLHWAALLLGLTATGCSESVYLDSEGPSSPTTSSSRTPTATGIPKNATFLLRIGPDGSLEQAGSAGVTIDTARLHDGALRTVKGSPEAGASPAIDFPGFVRTEYYPRAIIRVVNAGTRDQLNPGTADFRFGADFVIDKESSGAAADNGDNLVQRGLSSDPVMFKVEIDRDRPSCLVRGAEGVVAVRSADFIQPGWWYRVECHRTEDAVTLTLTEFAPDGSVTTTETTAPGRTGAIVMPEAGVPLSVGGKLARNGGPIESATDQFNGRAANAYLVIAR